MFIQFGCYIDDNAADVDDESQDVSNVNNSSYSESQKNFFTLSKLENWIAPHSNCDEKHVRSSSITWNFHTFSDFSDQIHEYFTETIFTLTRSIKYSQQIKLE